MKTFLIALILFSFTCQAQEYTMQKERLMWSKNFAGGAAIVLLSFHLSNKTQFEATNGASIVMGCFIMIQSQYFLSKIRKRSRMKSENRIQF